MCLPVGPNGITTMISLALASSFLHKRLFLKVTPKHFAGSWQEIFMYSWINLVTCVVRGFLGFCFFCLLLWLSTGPWGAVVFGQTQLCCFCSCLSLPRQPGLELPQLPLWVLGLCEVKRKLLSSFRIKLSTQEGATTVFLVPQWVTGVNGSCSFSYSCLSAWWQGVSLWGQIQGKSEWDSLLLLDTFLFSSRLWACIKPLCLVSRKEQKALKSDRCYMGPVPSSVTYQLCDLGQVSQFSETVF